MTGVQTCALPIYIPLGGNRKGRLRKQGNLLTVFTVSGLWHGASFAFLFWGLLNGIYQVVEDAVSETGKWLAEHIRKLRECLGYSEEKAGGHFSTEVFRTVRTFLLVSFAWLFFRAGGMDHAMEILKMIFHENNWVILFDGSLYELGVAPNQMNVLLASMLLLFVVDYHKYRGKDVADAFLRQGWWFRVSGIMFLLFIILLYGCYGELYDLQQFIYFQF